MNAGVQNFLRIIKNPVKFKAFLFSKLPAAFFSGLKIEYVDENKCFVGVPFKWLTQNPFKSTYFASLAMAAELSTGVFAMMYVYKRKEKISMLVTNMQASYFKKVTGTATFKCEEGKKIHSVIEKVISTNMSETIMVKSIGSNKEGELIAEFFFTWSFKLKQL